MLKGAAIGLDNFLVLTKRITVSGDENDLKSENVGLPVELRMSNSQINDQRTPWNLYFRPFVLLLKPIKIDPVSELSRALFRRQACAVKNEDSRYETEN